MSTELTMARLANDAREGELRLDGGVAERCADACTVLLESLDTVYVAFRTDGWRAEFGDFRAGTELAIKYERLAIGPDASFREALLSHADTVTIMRNLVLAAGDEYREELDANVSRLDTAGELL